MLNKKETIFGIKKKHKKYAITELGYNNRIFNFSYLKIQSSYIDSFLKKKLQGKYLQNFINKNIDFLKTIKCYRGFRHIKNLPVRGQRTHTNAKTIKNKYKKKDRNLSQSKQSKTEKTKDIKEKI